MVLYIIILVLLLGAFGTSPWYGYSRGWGYGPSGIIWALLVLAVVLGLLGVT